MKEYKENIARRKMGAALKKEEAEKEKKTLSDNYEIVGDNEIDDDERDFLTFVMSPKKLEKTSAFFAYIDTIRLLGICYGSVRSSFIAAVISEKRNVGKTHVSYFFKVLEKQGILNKAKKTALKGNIYYLSFNAEKLDLMKKQIEIQKKRLSVDSSDTDTVQD